MGQRGKPAREVRVIIMVLGESLRGFSLNHFSSEWVIIKAA